VQLNGQSIGTTLIHSLTGRSSGTRHRGLRLRDFAALVRVRFVTQAGGIACTHRCCWSRKQKSRPYELPRRCYPSAFVSDADRHVLTPTRDLAQGERAELDVANECDSLLRQDL